ncbi:MAG: HEAT repeat domain-containing protein [Myxococcota bacterium]
MTGRYALALIIPALAALVLTGCPKDEYDPQTWIEKLDDPNPQAVDEAIRRLQRLKDPVAVGPLGEAWRRQNRPQRVLRVLIELAERDQDGKGPTWDDAIEYLEEAVSDLDVSDERSIENAVIAAEALGRAQDRDSIPTLIAAAKKDMPKLSKAQRVRLTAVRSMGKFGQDPRTVDTLIGILKTDESKQPPQLYAAAADALSEARDPKAIVPLLETLYKLPLANPQARRALIATGLPAIEHLIRVIKGEHTEMNALAKEFKFNIDCEKEIGPETTCLAPTNLEYKAAQLLGDLYAKDAVSVLLAELDKTALPAFFQGGAPGPTQHAAVLDALRKIGDRKSAARVLTYATDPKTYDEIRPLAIDVYSFIANDEKALDSLAKFIKDDDAEEQVRLSAGMAYGRLVRSSGKYEPLTYMIERYRKEADKREGKRKKAEKAFKDAETAFKEAQKKADENKDDEKLQTAAEKAQEKMDDKQQDSMSIESEIAGYRRFQRTFEQNLARAHLGVKCKQDPKCYIDVLDTKADDVGKDLDKYIKDWKDWSPQEKKDLHIAAMERSLLELAKLGDKARPVFDKILEKVESTERIIRQGTLLVMARTAELPCDKCADRLKEVVESQEDQSTLGPLNSETRAARAYFLWAGK